MVAKLKTKRTSITTMRAKIQAFDIFQTPISSHYPLPLRYITDFNGDVLLCKTNSRDDIIKISPTFVKSKTLLQYFLCSK
jgi:hypothetical protein